ncbi:MAG: hypothetical protein MRJ68_12590 [Nitrospira sp.]|nr:hypothetical protein [Nitrospira sp.]
MWLTATKRVRIESKAGTFRLQPGCPVEVPDNIAVKVLDQAQGKVQVVPAPILAPAFTEVPPSYRVGELVRVHSLDGSVWIGQVVTYQHEPPGQGTLPGHWYCVEHQAKQAWVHESLVGKEIEG